MILTTASFIALLSSSAAVGLTLGYLVREKKVQQSEAPPHSVELPRNDEEELKVRDVLHAAVSGTQNKSRREFVAARLAASQNGQYGTVSEKENS